MDDPQFLEEVERKGRAWWRGADSGTRLIVRGILAFLAMVLIGLAVLGVMSMHAEAAEACTPVVIYPPDISVKCMSGQLVVDSDLMPMALQIGYPCRGYS